MNWRLITLDFEIKIWKWKSKELNFPKIEFPKDLEKYPEEIKSKFNFQKMVLGRKPKSTSDTKISRKL